MRRLNSLPVCTVDFGRLLQRFLQRAARSGFHRTLEVGVRHLQVVLRGDGCAVANPRRHHLNRVFVGQFRLARAAEILEELRPRGDASPLEDTEHLRPEIRPGVPAASDDEFRSRRWPAQSLFGLGERRFEQRTEFREQRNDARLTAGMMLGLGACDVESAGVEIDVAPRQHQMLGRASQPTEAGQGEQEFPFDSGAGVENALGNLSRDEVELLRVRSDVSCEVCERIVGNQSAPHRRAKELLGPSASATDGIVSESPAHEHQPPVVRIARSDGVEGALAECVFQALGRLSQEMRRPGLHVHAAGNVVINERGDRRHFHRCVCVRQPHGHELGPNIVIETVEPRGHGFRQGMPETAGADEMLQLELERLGGLERNLAEPERAALVGQLELNDAATALVGAERSHRDVPFGETSRAAGESGLTPTQPGERAKGCEIKHGFEPNAGENPLFFRRIHEIPESVESLSERHRGGVYPGGLTPKTRPD